MGKFWATGAGIAVLLTHTLAWAAWPDTEERCDELGAACACSEPLSSSMSISGAVEVDIPESTTRDCQNRGKTLGNSGSTPRFVSVSDMTKAPYNFPAFPAGATVDRIVTKDVSGQFNVRDDSYILSNQTYCRRHYFVLHETMDLDYSNGDRIKMSRNSGGNPEIHHETEFQWGGAFRTYETGPNDWGSWNESNQYAPSLSQVRDKWWRMEHCYDHRPDGRLQHRARVVDIQSGATYELPVNVSPGSRSNFSTGSPNNWIVEGFRQARSGVLRSGMWSGFSAAMSTITSYDPTFWIGPAAEIEGQTSGGTPPSGGGTPGGGDTGDGGGSGGGDPNAGTGLPFSDSFESGLAGWPDSPGDIQRSSTRAAGGTFSASGLSVSGTESSRWLNRAWGDARNTCTNCFTCDLLTECPGGRTPDLWMELNVYADWSGGVTPNGKDRKILQLAMFEDWNSSNGSYLQHSITYISLLFGDFDGDGQVDDLSWNAPRRHDGSGSPTSDVWLGDAAMNAFPMNQWNNIVMHAVENDPGQSNGVIRIWANGNLVVDRSNVDFFGGYDGGQTWNMLLLTDNGDGPTSPDTLRLYWDDVTITTDPITAQPPSQPASLLPPTLLP